MLFLEEFWNGNIAPGEGRYHSPKEYREALGLVESMEDQLKEQLPQEHWELFTKYQDAERGADCISNADIFIEGFRMGARAIMDVLLTTKAHSS
jgi:hypothetical protein